MRRPLGRQKIVAMLEQVGELTAREAAQAAFVCEKTARTVMGQLHEEKKTYIVDWYREERPGVWEAVYKLGQGKDKQYPQPFTDYERRKRYLRKKADPRRCVARDRVGEKIMPWIFGKECARRQKPARG